MTPGPWGLSLGSCGRAAGGDIHCPRQDPRVSRLRTELPSPDTQPTPEMATVPGCKLGEPSWAGRGRLQTREAIFRRNSRDPEGGTRRAGSGPERMLGGWTLQGADRGRDPWPEVGQRGGRGRGRRPAPPPRLCRRKLRPRTGCPLLPAIYSVTVRRCSGAEKSHFGLFTHTHTPPLQPPYGHETKLGTSGNGHLLTTVAASWIPFCDLLVSGANREASFL